jgi:integrase
MQKMISAVLLRERVLIFLDMMTGLRRGELAGLKWEDIDVRPKSPKNRFPSTNTSQPTCWNGTGELHTTLRATGFLPWTAIAQGRSAASNHFGYAR